MKIYDFSNILINLRTMIWKSIIFLFLSSNFQPQVDHAIYITVMDIHMNTNDQRGEIIIKSFSDDLANALHNMSSKFALQVDPAKAPEFVATYIKEKLELKIDQNIMPLDIQSITVEGETHWIKISFKLTNSVSQVNIHTGWFTELFLTQQNIIKLKVDEERRYQRLGLGQQEAQWEF